MVNYKEKLDEAIHLAQQKGFEQTRAEWLMLDVFQWTRTFVVLLELSYRINVLLTLSLLFHGFEFETSQKMLQ